MPTDPTRAAMRAEAARLLAQITPGEWMRGEENESRCEISPLSASIRKNYIMRGNANWKHDVAFIAAAPTLVRTLLDALEEAVRLLKLVRPLESQLDREAIAAFIDAHEGAPEKETTNG